MPNTSSSITCRELTIYTILLLQPLRVNTGNGQLIFSNTVLKKKKEDYGGQ